VAKRATIPVTVGRLRKKTQPLGIVAQTRRREVGGRIYPVRGRGTPTITQMESRFAAFTVKR